MSAAPLMRLPIVSHKFTADCRIIHAGSSWHFLLRCQFILSTSGLRLILPKSTSLFTHSIASIASLTYLHLLLLHHLVNYLSHSSQFLQSFRCTTVTGGPLTTNFLPPMLIEWNGWMTTYSALFQLAAHFINFPCTINPWPSNVGSTSDTILSPWSLSCRWGVTRCDNCLSHIWRTHESLYCFSDLLWRETW